MGPAAGNRALLVLMATIFVDMIGFFLVLPLLPFYAEHYGADALIVGALISTFALAQLATAPAWGRLSDRRGRKPVILLGLLCSALAYLLFAVADSIWLLFLSRLAQGAGGGILGVTQAYVSDAVGPEERTKALGWVTAAASAGVMVGPALGSLAAQWHPTAPGLCATGLCLLNVVSAWRWLPGTRRRGADLPPGQQRSSSLWSSVLEVIRRPGLPVSRLIWIYTLGMMAFFAMNGVIALYLERRFGFDEKTIGWFYIYVGGVSLLVRGLLLGPAVRRLGELRLLGLGATALAVGLAAIPVPERLSVFAVVAMLIPLGTAMLFPSTTSLVSQHAPEPEVGQTLGVQQAFGGISRMVGPIWGGALFEYVRVEAPFWISSLLVLAVVMMARPLRRQTSTSHRTT